MAHDRLLDIAVREFGSKGLDGASTRGIAAAAGTAMSAITYHYGGKDGLYLAAADHIAQEMGRSLAPALDEPPPGDAAAARVDLHRLLCRLADAILVDDGGEWSLFIMREQMRPAAAFDRLYAGPMGRMAERVVLATAMATGASAEAARTTAIMLVGQVLVWRASRALAERVLEHAIDEPARKLIFERLSANVDCILDSLSAPKEPQ